MNDSVLRTDLVDLLQGGQAHVTPRKVLEGIESRIIDMRPTGFEHSIRQMVEHLRIAQEDILRYTLDSSWQSPEFPAGYWHSGSESNDEAWSRSLSGFFSDLDAVIGLVQDPRLELTAEIPHGEGRTYLREVLLVVDHNAYHLGQIVQIRKVIGDWKE